MRRSDLSGVRIPQLQQASRRHEAIDGWTFERSLHQRVWVVDAGTPVGDVEFQATADDLLAALVIGDPRPHPVDPADWGTNSEPTTTGSPHGRRPSRRKSDAFGR